jgi:hypothetical protein
VDSVRGVLEVARRGSTRAAAPNGRRRPGRPSKLSPEQQQAAADRLYAHGKANPGQRSDQIAKALGTTPDGMRSTMQRLVAEKRVTTKGQPRGTTYFAAGAAMAAVGPARRGAGPRHERAPPMALPHTRRDVASAVTLTVWLD